jgi:hypothetical protein
MNCSLLKSISSAATLCLLFSSTTFAQSPWTVAPCGGTGTFSDVGSAIAAASPGDTILIEPGTYPGFTLTTDMRILGRGSVFVDGNILVTGTAIGTTTVLSDLTAVRVHVSGCDGTVLLSNVDASCDGVPVTVDCSASPAVTALLDVTLSEDVRIHGYDHGSGYSSAIGLRVFNSRVEVVDAFIRGTSGGLSSCGSESGQFGVLSTAMSRLHLVNTTVNGGWGGTANGTLLGCNGSGAGNGASAIGAFDNATVLIAGSGAQTIRGGRQGFGVTYNLDGQPGQSARVTGSLRATGVTFLMNDSLPGPPIVTGTLDLPAVDDPTLVRRGAVQPGQLVQLEVHADVGANVRIWTGDAQVQVLPSQFLERLTTETEGFAPGVVPASGVFLFDYMVPATMQAGDVLWAQSEVVHLDNSTRRTNSVPLLVGPSGPTGTTTVLCDPANDHSDGTYVDLSGSSFGSDVGSGLHLHASAGPTTTPEWGFFVMSAATGPNLTVGNGILCLGSPLGRFNVQIAANQGLPQLNSIGQFDPSGVFVNMAGTATGSGGLGFDVPCELPFTPPGQTVQSGDTLYYQCWYREGPSSNLSNAIRAEFP